MKTEWDEKNYSENFSFVHEYGEKILELITVPKGGYVVDLGCGNGALSAKLAEKYRVTGIDSSYEMLQAAKKSYPDIDFVQADACEFTLDNQADAIFSNAVFHWIENQENL